MMGLVVNMVHFIESKLLFSHKMYHYLWTIKKGKRILPIIIEGCYQL